MTLLQVLLVAISFVPYGLFSTYSLVTSSMTKEADRLEKEYFMLTVISLAPYLYYAVGSIGVTFGFVIELVRLGELLRVSDLVQSVSSSGDQPTARLEERQHRRATRRCHKDKTGADH